MSASRRVHLPDAVVVVTGAGSGIGRATAVAFAAQGSRVACLDIDGDAAGQTAHLCGALGRPARGMAVDVTDRPALAAAAAEIERIDGGVDVVVNNAGVGMSGRFLSMSADDWAWIRGVNLDGVLNGCAAFGPVLRRRGGGHVVNVSSGLAYTYTATEPAYVTTKAAVLAFSRCLRADWADDGIGVSVVCPGVIDTPIIDRTRFVGDDGRSRDRQVKLFRRGHRPEKVGAAIVAAVERNRGVVPVGVEAHVGWYLNRLLPVPAQQGLARLGARL